MAKTICMIKCSKCKHLFDSPIQFETAETFFTSSLIGNVVTCKICGSKIGCNKGNMYFNSRDGTIIHGDETIPQ